MRTPSLPPSPSTLRILRERQGVTQVELAKRTGLTQEAISRIEREVKNLQLATLRRYVEGLGGELELAASLGGERFPISLPGD